MHMDVHHERPAGAKCVSIERATGKWPWALRAASASSNATSGCIGNTPWALERSRIAQRTRAQRKGAVFHAEQEAQREKGGGAVSVQAQKWMVKGGINNPNKL